MELSTSGQSALLLLARQAITAALTGSAPPKPAELPPELTAPCGVFVTLHLGGELRGCIGFVLTEAPLWKTVRQAAVLAATEDPRFPAVNQDELPFIHMEISVLSLPEPLPSYDAIRVGVHGLIVEEGRHRGLLLPQVATENNFTREQFLSALCRKAGLPADAWRQRMLNLSSFTAIVFSEEQGVARR